MVMTDPTQGEGVVAALPEPVHFPYGSHYFDGSTSARPDDAPWLEWAGPGTYYKLLHLDADTGFMVFLLKLDPGIPGVVHKHYGAAMGYVLEGDWGYADRWFTKGTFFKEAGQLSHGPDVGPEGSVVLAFGFGPITFFDDDGGILGIVDQHMMYERAKAAGAADQIVFQRPPSSYVGKTSG